VKKIGLIWIAAVCVLLLSNVASATHWVLAVRSEGKDKASSFSMYIDADSVVKSGDTFAFWMLTVSDAPAFGTKKTLEKDEARLTRPPMVRTVESYFYDDTGALIALNSSSDEYDAEFQPYPTESNLGKCVSFALKYAKEGKLGKGTSPKPVP
jgi:hypothetical protein